LEEDEIAARFSADTEDVKAGNDKFRLKRFDLFASPYRETARA
jgi:hypothetical protein